jgi:hypothetical protein
MSMSPRVSLNMRRRPGLLLLTGVFALLALLDAWQLLEAAPGEHSDPPGLLVTHGITGALAGVAAVGIGRARPWAAWVTVCWGAATAGMLMVLGPVLREPPETWGALRTAGAVVAGFSIVAAWYVRGCAGGTA